MSKSSNSGSPQLHLPAGFRFHPTDEELVVHYLAKKAEGKPFPVTVISEVDLYKFNPWELPDKAHFGEREWYFFTPRDRKYPNGARPNRAAASGYWKATGTDKPIFTRGNKKVGVKKALVFYDGKAPKGIKTNWIMHEYRLAAPAGAAAVPKKSANQNTSLRLDDWVLCRIYEKTSSAFKVMVSNIEAEPAYRRSRSVETPEHTEVETEAETEADVELEVEPEVRTQETSGLDEMLASLPDIDGSKLAFLPHQCQQHHYQSLVEDVVLNTGTESLSERLEQTLEAESYSRAQSSGCFGEDSRLFEEVDTKFDNLNSYWSLYPNFFGKEMISPFIRRPSASTPNRKRARIDDDDVQSTCRSPLSSCKSHKQQQQLFAIF